MVSYRVSESFGEMPFVGTLLEVHDSYVVISPNDPPTPTGACAVPAKAGLK